MTNAPKATSPFSSAMPTQLINPRALRWTLTNALKPIPETRQPEPQEEEDRADEDDDAGGPLRHGVLLCSHSGAVVGASKHFDEEEARIAGGAACALWTRSACVAVRAEGHQDSENDLRIVVSK